MPDNSVPMLAPDGSVRQVPQEQTASAIQAGGKLVTQMVSPQGEKHWVPFDSVHDAISAGGQLAAPPLTVGGPQNQPAMQQVDVAGNPQKPVQFMGSPAIPDALAPGDNAVTDATAGIARGIVKGAGQTIAPGPRTAQAINTATGMSVPSTATPELQTQGTAENVGAGLEGVGEFILGDEALKGLSLAERAGILSKVAKLAESHPIVAKALKIGMNAVRSGTVGAGQGLLHGQSVGEAAATGAVAGGTGAVLETAAEGVKALAPIVKEIAGEKIPVRASQESGLARTAENLANPSALEKFDVQQTQPAAKRAIGNVASEVRDAALEDNFKDWFGKSKVVDENDKPLRVYHGTRAGTEFKEFTTEGRPMVEGEHAEGEYTTSGSGADPTSYMGAHFAEEPRVANKFASGSDWMKSRFEAGGEKPRVIPTYLSIENPKNFGAESNLRSFIYEGKLSGYEGDELLNRAMEADGIDDPESPEAEKWTDKYDSDAKFRQEQNKYLFESFRPGEGEDEMLDTAAQDLARDAKARLKQSGFDGAVYKNEVEGGTSHIAFEPQQIKPAISTPGPKSLPTAASLKEAAQDLRGQAKPVFEKLDSLSQGEEMKFSDWQKAERSAIRRGDYEAATKAKAAQDGLIGKYADRFSPNDLQNARANWRQASALEDIDRKLNTKSVLGPTPEELRPENSPDPGYINGKQFSKQLLSLRNAGSLKQAGLTPDHVQTLQNVGTLLERGNVQPSQMSQILQLAGKFSKKVSGTQWVISKLMTEPKFASGVESILKSSATKGVASKALSGILQGAQPVLGGER